ncbi:hypothetical protein WV31_09630 [Magnetospirillum sp. ME-1]|uniref:response regulator n=1 Tax=Magnetospirillum sp. ME-1 TaxID=1639348 RepID=UPI000A17F608|nr:response regulator [Magnetospirillum sp. ME-1]ARJ65899.1 hypothetical protein WV31_09630 [Magnetospirillum sp. ME-1]
MSDPASVLVVDDSPDSLELMKSVLGGEYRVRVAIGGDPALRLASQAAPDIVLLDVMMPDMDGYEVCRRLKAEPALADVPVIFISSLYAEEDEEKGFRAGAVDYITKPISPPLLKARVATHLKLARQRRQLEQAREKAEQEARVKAEFLAFMSHEIRTPLTGMLGTLGLLRETRLDGEQDGYVRVLHSAGDALLAILNDALDVIKSDAGKLSLEVRPFHLGQMAEGVVALMNSRATEKGLTLSLRVDPTIPEVVQGDSMRLSQILLNLVGNAVKFTETGGVELTVSPGSPGRLMFKVSDTGIGIVPDVLPTLFADFTQQDSSISRRFGGTGLGLSICRRLAELMEGTVEAASTLGQGSVFTLDLPLLPGRLEQVAEPRSPAKGAELNILVADDNPLNQKVAQAMLTSRGHTVHTVSDGEAAISAVAEGCFDLVLMDVRMRGLGGLEASRRIRALPGAKGRTPIIALTGAALDEDRALCLEAGMDDVVLKPYSRNHLLDVIARTVPFKTVP